MTKYSIHIAALKPDSKATEMPRVTYNELRFDILVDAQTETEKVIRDVIDFNITIIFLIKG